MRAPWDEAKAPARQLQHHPLIISAHKPDGLSINSPIGPEVFKDHRLELNR